MEENRGKFTTGSTLRHVIVMTLSGSLGLLFVFIVDFAALWWVSQLGEERLVAAVGFGWIIQFAVTSVTIGLTIAVTAMVAPMLGRGATQTARDAAAQAMVFSVATMLVVSAIVWIFRDAIVGATGAEGETRQIAGRFLAFSIPSMPFMVVGMVTSGVLRAAGAALHAMLITVAMGLTALIVDPFLIVWMGLGVEGAAISIILSRLAMALTGLWYAVRIHGLIGPLRMPDTATFLRPFLAIALPAIATQMSTPFGNWILTRSISEFGDGAVAGWGVVTRLTILIFGGIFALSGAIGGIFGQNYGVGEMDRVRQTYRDALRFCALYTMLAWALLFATQDFVVASFGLGPDGARVVLAFTTYAAGAFVFTGALFVANSAFNNLGRPLWSTGFNWMRDGILTLPLAILMGSALGSGGVIYAQATAGLLAGVFATFAAIRFITRLRAPLEAGR